MATQMRGQIGTVAVNGQEYRVELTALAPKMPYKLISPGGGTTYLVRLDAAPDTFAAYRAPSLRKVRFTDQGGAVRVA